MLQREIWNDLISWKKRPHHPLIIKGLRQIGKTYIVKHFGKKFYENVVYLDLRANKAVHKAFDGNFDVTLTSTANIEAAIAATAKILTIFFI